MRTAAFTLAIIVLLAAASIPAAVGTRDRVPALLDDFCNSKVEVLFALPLNNEGSLTVYDVRGRRLKTLSSGRGGER